MPVTDDIFYAQAGQKAYWGKEEIHIPKPDEINNESVLLTYSRFHNHYRSTFPGKIRNLGSTAAHICYVARGRAEGALLAHVSYQDLAAAQIILNAAGGKICRLDGSEFHLSEYLGGQRIEEHLLAAARGPMLRCGCTSRNIDERESVGPVAAVGGIRGRKTAQNPDARFRRNGGTGARRTDGESSRVRP